MTLAEGLGWPIAHWHHHHMTADREPSGAGLPARFLTVVRLLSGCGATVEGMGYCELRPPPALAGLAECGWVDAATVGGPHDVLPDGCMDLVWTGERLVVAGPDTVPQHGVRTPGVTVAGVRFLPGVLPSLLEVPAVDLHNNRVPLVDLLPAATVRAAVGRLETGEAPLPVLTGLACRLPGAPPDRSITALRRALGPGSGDAGVEALADTLGCTPRSVHRRCLMAFGYGPAVFRRVLRFRRATALLRTGVPPAEVAAQVGYADQPHLSREVRVLAGASPLQLAGGGANRSTPLPSGSRTTA
jgi:AraC-like DNA-binding protein